MSRSRAEFEDELRDEGGFPLAKKTRLYGDHDDYGYSDDIDGSGGQDSIFGRADGRGFDDVDGHDDDDDDDDVDVPDGGGHDGDGGARKRRKKPWRVHGRPGGSSMHNANLYRRYRPDFRELAREYPDTFGPHVIDDPESGRATIDWKSPEAMRELTRVMLLHDFGLEWNVPLDRLCPPVANRLNYICWLSDLMKLRKSSGGGDGGGVDEAERNLLLFGSVDGGGGVGGGGEREEEEAGMMMVGSDDALGAAERASGEQRHRRGRGIDVGTGASCIYPLLGAKVAAWSFLATETDVVSAECAEKNVRTNGLQNQVTVRVVSPSGLDGDGPGPLLTALTDQDGEFDFAMTNPPFFASEDEAGQNPDTATAEMATSGEVACEGGEEAFVRAIIRDSLKLKQRVRWYTSMIGKKSNAKKLLRALREAGIKNTRTTEFFQGRTVRWGLAWSFTTEGMVGNKVPDDPSIKVFSKKKTAGRTQHNLRRFSVPLRSAESANASVEAFVGNGGTGKREGEGKGISAPAGGVGAGASAGSGSGSGLVSGEVDGGVKISVPGNLPADASEVVERMKSSLRAFKQADINIEAVDEDDLIYSYPASMNPTTATTTTTTTTIDATVSASAVAASDNNNNNNDDNNNDHNTRDGGGSGGFSATRDRRFRCEAHSRKPSTTTTAPTPTRTTATATTATTIMLASSSHYDSPHEVPDASKSSSSASPLFAFELEVHGAAEWAGAAAAGASIQVWARQEEGGDRAAFQRMWETLQHDVLRQNRRWRREMVSRYGRGGAEGREVER